MGKSFLSRIKLLLLIVVSEIEKKEAEVIEPPKKRKTQNVELKVIKGGKG